MYIMIATLWFWSYPSSMAFCRGRVRCSSLTSAQLFDTPVVTRSRLDLVFPAMLTSKPAKIYRTGQSWAMSRAGFFSIAWPESTAANTCSGAYHWLTDASNIEPHHNSCAQRSVAVLCCLLFSQWSISRDCSPSRRKGGPLDKHWKRQKNTPQGAHRRLSTDGGGNDCWT